jgi:hypothetical protein
MKLTLTDMRAEGVHSVSLDCSCGAGPDLNVDHLPGDMAVPDVRKHVRCVCGKVPVRVIPFWKEGHHKRPGYRV